MTEQLRIPPTEVTGVTGALAKTFSRRMLGEVPESLGVMWRHQGVLKGFFGVQRKADKWKECDKSLKSIAHMAVASLVGCSFCLDLAYFMAHNEKLDEVKASQVPRWRESDVFTSLERDVLEYAEAMCQTPPAVTDDLSARLLDRLGPAALLELTAVVAMANMVTRTNVALGITSQGFSKVCALPLAERPAAAAAAAGTGALVAPA